MESKRIKQLSKHLINQIAAGEVIERPASVVKELVENSIDAGATKISIEISNECRDIRIADNGSGIHPDDIALAFSKHATSKIETDEDLFAISTLGFRGEALSSIISIAKVTCTTRTKEFDYGTKVECENSQVKTTKTGCAVGTIMDVRNLFYNLPARLKFLRASKTEFSYIQELVQSLAMINPGVGFELKNNGKTMLKTTTGGKCGENLGRASAKKTFSECLCDLKNAIKEVYSAEVVSHLKEVIKTDKLSGFKISGFVSTPDYTRSSKKAIHIYINSRAVKCPVLQKSIDMAYKNLIGHGKYPFVVVNLEVPPSEIDVNVHPSKKEVRYKNTNQIFNFVYSAVNMALSNTENFGQRNEIEAEAESSINVEHLFKKEEGRSGIPARQNEDEDDIYVSDEALVQQTLLNNPSPEFQSFVPHNEILPSPARGEGISSIQSNSDVAQPQDNIIGQYKNTYILIEREEGLEIVDQHIAQERFIYEKLSAQKQPASQLLLVSDVLEVSPTEAELIKDNIEKFEKFGYGIEFLKSKTSANSLIFRKVPQMLSRVSPKDLLADLLANLEGNLDNSVDNLEEKILIMTACKASVKAGQKLNIWQMQEIIKDWRSCEMPYTCPHGRPISKTIAHKQIAGFFERSE